VIESARAAVQYASSFVHLQKPINGSIVFDLPHEHLYLATLTKVPPRLRVNSAVVYGAFWLLCNPTFVTL